MVAELWWLMFLRVKVVPVVGEVHLEDLEPVFCRLFGIFNELDPRLCHASPVLREQLAIFCNGPFRTGATAIDLL